MDRYRIVTEAVAREYDDELHAIVPIVFTDTLWRGETQPTEQNWLEAAGNIDEEIEGGAELMVLQERRIVNLNLGLGRLALPLGWRKPAAAQEEVGNSLPSPV